MSSERPDAHALTAEEEAEEEEQWLEAMMANAPGESPGEAPRASEEGAAPGPMLSEDDWHSRMMDQGTDGSCVRPEGDHVWEVVREMAEGGFVELVTEEQREEVVAWLQEQIPRTIRVIGMLRAPEVERITWRFHVDRLPAPRAFLLSKDKDGGLFDLGVHGLTIADAVGMVHKFIARHRQAVKKIMFSALEGCYVEPLQIHIGKTFPPLKYAKEEPCNMWVLPLSSQLRSKLPPELPSGLAITPLTEEDADIVDRTWKYTEPGRTIHFIRKIIACNTCVGLRENGRLVSWIISYHDGALGMMYTLDECRGKGYAGLVASALIEKLTRADPHFISFCFIVKSNTHSEKLFNSLGFTNLGTFTWIYFFEEQQGQQDQQERDQEQHQGQQHQGQ